MWLAAAAWAGGPVWRLVATPTDGLGWAVAGVGDVDGDGFADVLVGRPAWGEYRGRAELYRGSTTGLSPTPSWTVEGGERAFLGAAVAAAGDVDADGFADVLVATGPCGTPGRRCLALFRGGRGGLAATPAWTTPHQADVETSATRVVGDLDVDGDPSRA
jgi:hypothetical protein